MLAEPQAESCWCRGAANDVGEIRRVLNSFLQFLELDSSDSLIVAATNHPQLLDRAMFRRFDAVIDYPLPSQEVVRKVIRNRLASISVGRLGWAKIDEAAAGLSHGEVTVAAELAAKEACAARKVIAARQAAYRYSLMSSSRTRVRSNLRVLIPCACSGCWWGSGGRCCRAWCGRCWL
jgi:SpoVK/Ycf46/Vps4 family AAA+-type ATPase